jgi:hypothetical protein
MRQACLGNAAKNLCASPEVMQEKVAGVAGGRLIEKKKGYRSPRNNRPRSREYAVETPCKGFKNILLQFPLLRFPCRFLLWPEF